MNEIFDDLPPEKAHDPNDQEESDLNSSEEALLILYEFFGHDEMLDNIKQTLCNAIHDHLYTCGKSENPVQAVRIKDICDKAIELLPDVKEDGFFSTEISKAILKKEEKHSYSFESYTLESVPLLLPEDGEIGKAVIQCLPYLLTCYTGNVPKRGIDPFGGESQSSGWDDIFNPSENVAVGDGNRSRTIKTMCIRFTKFPNRINWGGLLDSGDEFLFDYAAPAGNTDQGKDSALYVDDFPLKSKNPEWEKAEKQSSIYAKCWELYRRFASFCEACKDVKEVNLTLSMALFAYGLKICPWPKSVKQNSWELINCDFLREDILDVVKRYDEYGCIQGIHQRAQLARLQYLRCINKKQ